jgi:plasmid stabilization system protein ParE
LKLIWSKAALRDLDELAVYIAEDSARRRFSLKGAFTKRPHCSLDFREAGARAGFWELASV